MNSDPDQRDSELRTAIDEYREAADNHSQIYREASQWQQENPPPRRPKSVQSISEIEEFERKNDEWNKPYRTRIAQQDEAEKRSQEKRKRLESLLPRDFAYDYKGKRYEYGSGGLRIDEIS